MTNILIYFSKYASGLKNQKISIVASYICLLKFNGLSTTNSRISKQIENTD